MALVLGQVTALLLAGAGATAQAGSAIQACADIDADAERLACYDRVSGRAAAQPEAAGIPATALTAQPAAQPPAEPADLAAADAGAPMTAPAATDEPITAPVVRTDESRAASLLTNAWSFAPDSERYLIKLYRPNYVNPVRYQSRTNEKPLEPLLTALDSEDSEVDNLEAAFQISFKTRFWASDDRRWGGWFAYTQQSLWQVYNSEKSSPFRDTNYMPELKLAWQPQLSFGGFDWQLLSLGYTHESNGRADPISRSWDRLVAEIGIEKGDFALLLRPWIRIDDAGDDNPDITDYYGYGDLTAVYKWRGHSFTLMGRGNPVEKKGALRVSWMTPRLLGPLRGYLVGFTGYGDTLLDYNFKQNAVSAGVALNDILDR